MKPALPLVATMVFGLFVALPPMAASKDAVVTAVFSSTSNGYERQKQPDGSFKREYYAIANGQYKPGLDANPSIDKVPFPTIAGLVAGHLAKQNYFLAPDAKSADILLLISWGTTAPFNNNLSQNSLDRLLSAMNAAQLTGHSRLSVANTLPGTSGTAQSTPGGGELDGAMIEVEMYNDIRRRADEWNARLLGYSKEINGRDSPARFAGTGTAYEDLIQDIEEERYYIVVSAYDFKSATQDGKRKLLWATRVSVRAQGNRFDEQLKTMLANAGQHFGQETHDLLRQYHSGTVRMDDLKYTSYTPESTGSAKAAEKK
jgi:hypothetical protein